MKLAIAPARGWGDLAKKSAIRGNRKNREAPEEGAFILEKLGQKAR